MIMYNTTAFLRSTRQFFSSMKVGAQSSIYKTCYSTFANREEGFTLAFKI